jgi:hypothetical protein
MVNHSKALTVEVLPNTHMFSVSARTIREGWRVGDFYIIASDVCGKECFFVTEAVAFDCFGAHVQIISRPFKSFRDAHKIAVSSARALRREMRETGPLLPSAIKSMLRSLVTHQTITTKAGARAAR